MCGIVGYIGDKAASDVLIHGLSKLEYRGYDSAGVVVLNQGDFQLRRCPGKLAGLSDLLKKQPVHGSVGLGHTRWATHGRPSEENAHPHTGPNGKIVVVHNGIIENYVELKQALTAKGLRFRSQTDTEVIAYLIEEAYQGDLVAAVRKTLEQLRGSFAIGVSAVDQPELLVAARKDSPLILGLGENEHFLASDVPAILQYTRRVIFLEDGDLAEVRRSAIRITDFSGKPVDRRTQTILWDAVMAEKGGYKHFMMKEIHEQVVTVRDTFRSRINMEEGRVELDDSLPKEVAKKVNKICFIGCGTSYHSALVARFWIEELAGVPCDVEIASEFRYRRSQKELGTLIVPISQSGETADTLAALRDCKSKGFPTMAICNVVGSTITRDADHMLLTHCGPEIGVASTKAFTGQLTALFLLALYLGQERGRLEKSRVSALLQALSHIPLAISHAVAQAPEIEKIAKRLFRAKDFLYLGRHLNYPIALEGALKLKEISYIHAEGYPAGEMKHGPIALIDEDMPIVAIAPKTFIHEKMLSNIQEVKARGGQVIAVAEEGDPDIEKHANYVLWIPHVEETLTPLLTIIPLQLLSYFIAMLRGCDVDQPRNLAKSVTVE